MTSDPQLVARLLDLVARQLHSGPPSKDLVAGQWAIIRYLGGAGLSARTASHISTYLGSGLPEARRALLSLQRKGLIEPYGPAASDAAYHLTSQGKALGLTGPINRAAAAIGNLPERDRLEFARLLEAVANGLAG